MALTIFECMMFTFAILSGILVIFDVWESYYEDESEELNDENCQKLLKELSRQQFYSYNTISRSRPNRFYH